MQRPPAPIEPEIRPCIAELLRTGYHPSELILRVERVIEVLFTPDTTTATGTTTPATPNRRSYRIFLSDGELVIQALLGKALHRFALTGEVTVGAVVKLDRFEIRKGERVGVGGGEDTERGREVVFLAVGGFRCLSKIGAEERKQRTWVKGDDVEVRLVDRKRKRGNDDNNDDDDDGADGAGGSGFGSRRGEKAPRIGNVNDTANMKPDEGGGYVVDEMLEFSSGISDNAFDSASQSFGGRTDSKCTQKPTKDDQGSSSVFPKFQAPFQNQEEPVHVRNLPVPNLAPSQSQPNPPETTIQEPLSPATLQSPHIQNERSRAATPIPTTAATEHPFKLPGILKPISRPLNLLTLSQLLYPAKPLPKRNYLCDVLAVISWVSPDIVKRPQMPPKRDLRIMDPTIADQQHHALQRRLGVSVSVFADAATFSPPVGTVGLFRSLKTHEWEGVSLNAYEKDCKGREWVVCDPSRLKRMMIGVGKEGSFDIEAMKEWWKGWCKEVEKGGQKREREMSVVDAGT
ncbi:hypothetical protein AJ78_06885 [Emergomyces pasteurianus Ep9510]|uniref:Uncharacterized protein n=1 Tax=Emergomyces pasteurianus Ep9510 TaxID=1447872 RepID=A0A1J9Q9E7_9EURO|nr:hypothetical protein AJ78_06885 [Emergomyces pasteurianus Ep9510]